VLFSVADKRLYQYTSHINIGILKKKAEGDNVYTLNSDKAKASIVAVRYR